MYNLDKPDKYYLGEKDENLTLDVKGFGVSIDCVIFGYENEKLKVLLIERGMEPHKDQWALPGDLVSPNEALRSAANRILTSLTSLQDIYLEQFFTFGGLDRHPAGRVITVGYYSLVNSHNYEPIASSWAKRTEWIDIDQIPQLAFDHTEIFEKAWNTLKHKVRHEPLLFELLPKKFTLLELQSLYEAILGEQFDKPNFRKKVLSTKFLMKLDEVQSNVSHRPAKLYQFDIEKYNASDTKAFNV